jgi:ATP phosphoribosyltransferase
MSPTDALISLAVPRGRLFEQLSPMLKAAGVPVEAADQDARCLTVEREGWRLLFARPRDIALFVERGVADYGLAGKDVLLEDPRQVVEVLDLGAGACRLVLAVPRPLPALERPAVRCVATKYPRLAGRLLAERGLTVEVLTMHGAVESAPGLGLADGIVDLVQTGATLKANGLVEMYTLLESTARLIANPVAFRLRGERARAWISNLRIAVDA